MKLGANLISNIAEILSSEMASAVGSANARLKQELKGLANATMAKADEMASQRLHTTRQQYVDSLRLEKVGPNIYSISLDDDAHHLETGYESFNMLAHGLARGPKSKISKKGYRYVHIPFQGKKGAAPGTPSGDRQIQHKQTVSERGWSAGSPSNAGVAPAQGLHTGSSLAAGIKELENKAGLSKQIRGIEGKVGTWNSHPANSKQAIFTSMGGNQSVIDLDGNFNPLLEGMMKFQNKVGKKTQSSYLTFRTASEDPAAKGKWIHPGFQGAKIFPELEAWAMQQLQKIISDF
jgi:hypothetical protein